MKKESTRSAAARPLKDPSPYPKGWNRKRVQSLINFYDKQTDDGAIAEAEAAYDGITTTMMPIPVKLVPKVQKLIGKRAG